MDVDVTQDAGADSRKRRRYEEEVRKEVEEHTVRVPQILRSISHRHPLVNRKKYGVRHS